MRVFVIAAVIAALAAPAVAAAGKPRCKTADGKPAHASACAHKSDPNDGMKAQPLKCRDVRNGNPTKCGGAYAVPSPVN